jgi:anti-sigma B factor antagonist
MMVQSSPEKDLLREGIFSTHLEGAVAMRTVPTMHKALLGVARKSEVREIHLDFSRVTVLDTAGVAMLVEIWRGLARRGGTLRLTGLSAHARRLIQLARLDQIFEVRDDSEGRVPYGS